MKHTLMIMATAGLALASCTTDDAVEVNSGRENSFRPAMS